MLFPHCALESRFNEMVSRNIFQASTDASLFPVTQQATVHTCRKMKNLLSPKFFRQINSLVI